MYINVHVYKFHIKVYDSSMLWYFVYACSLAESQYKLNHKQGETEPCLYSMKTTLDGAFNKTV